MADTVAAPQSVPMFVERFAPPTGCSSALTVPLAPRRFRLLIVEDNPAEAELIREWLSSVDPGKIDIAHAFDAQRALCACEHAPFDCIVLDLLLPDRSGAETIAIMLSYCPAAVIVAYSGMDNEASQDAALRAGAQYFFSKNTSDARALSRCILDVLERWRSQRSSPPL